MVETTRTKKGGGRAVAARICLVAILAIHLVAAAGWWYGMPGGFAIGKPKWWTNQVFPLCVIVLAVVALTQLIRSRVWRWAASAALACSGLWIGAAVALAIVFPASGLRIAPFALALGLIGVRIVWASNAISIVRNGSAAIMLGVAIGIAGVALQRAADPATRPLNTPIPTAITLAIPGNAERTIHLNAQTVLWPREQGIQTRLKGLQLTIEPALQFISRSPDRFWTSLAPAAQRTSPRTEIVSIDVGEFEARFAFNSDYRSTLRVRSQDEVTEIESASQLTSPIYSHLNSYCRVLVTGHRRLFLSFSPCPDERVEVLPSDYPVGRPARAAYLDADGKFAVVEASDAEKGPFRTLAQGPLKRGDPLTLTLYDENRLAAQITWLNWSAQVDTSPSPTAGWGLPCNAIEFSLVGNRASDAAAIYMTLAGTSLGRGWDSVGHAAGTYWNRMRIEAGRNE